MWPSINYWGLHCVDLYSKVNQIYSFQNNITMDMKAGIQVHLHSMQIPLHANGIEIRYLFSFVVIYFCLIFIFDAFVSLILISVVCYGIKWQQMWKDIMLFYDMPHHSFYVHINLYMIIKMSIISIINVSCSVESRNVQNTGLMIAF